MKPEVREENWGAGGGGGIITVLGGNNSRMAGKAKRPRIAHGSKKATHYGMSFPRDCNGDSTFTSIFLSIPSHLVYFTFSKVYVCAKAETCNALHDLLTEKDAIISNHSAPRCATAAALYIF